ncbi:branched-chain amino acid transaminase [Candidatus Gottesmanbacteria bacterium]|nr:branched-chain amino acid transaminase [Candidatus Gottesmanbacteria bacterium]
MKNLEYLPYAFFERKIVPTEEAKVSIMTNALQYGTGVIGGIRCYLAGDKKTMNIFRLVDHYKRFLNSLKILNVSIPFNHQKLVELTLALARKNKPQTDSYIRPFAYAANIGLSPDLSHAEMDLAIYMIPLGEYLPLSRGLKLAVSNWMRITDRMIPARAKISGGYINSAMARGDVARLGFDDALMMDDRGHITEASAANIFIVRDGVLITPSKYSDVLEGMTRRTIIELASDLKIKVEEREIDRSEIYVADEVFLSGTGVQVAWIDEVDGRKIGKGRIGPITHKLQKLFFDIVRGKEKKYSHWLTKV